MTTQDINEDIDEDFNAGIESAWPDHPGYAITATPFEGVARVRFGDVVLAESERALIVAESDHLDQVYVPADDVRWEQLEPSDHQSTCPFKGRASHWSVKGRGEEGLYAVWTYPKPFDEVADIAGHIGFNLQRVKITLTERWSDDERDQVTHAFPLWGTEAGLLRLMDVQPEGERRFIAPPYPDPPYGTFFESTKALMLRNVVEGGQLLGDLIVASSKTVPDKRVTSAYATFLEAAAVDAPVQVDVEVLRNGRTIAATEVRLRQDGSLRAAGMAMLDTGADEILRTTAKMPDVPSPRDCPVLDLRVLGRELREVDGCYRQKRGEVGPPEVNVWCRFREAPDEQALHQALLAHATTHWTVAAAMRPKEGMSQKSAHSKVSTAPLSVAIAFHDEIDVTQWMLYCNPAIHAGAGSAQGEGRVYAIDGRLLASYSVQAMIRPFTVPPDDLGGSQRAL